MRRLSATILFGTLLACTPRAEGVKTEEPKAEDGKVDPLEHALLDGTGAATRMAAFVASAAEADFVAFGEFHEHPIGAAVELKLLVAMSRGDRKVALSLEFFEADHQAAIDAYLRGEIDEAAFREQTKRNEAYETTHRPLVEFCKAQGIPVIAANAPRRLVTAYRKSGMTYAEWLASLSAEDRAFMPAHSEVTKDEFTERFLALMGPKRGSAFLPSMALWNDAMAESAAKFREAHPDHVVLLVVGGFHVAKHLGTVSRYLARRPDDRARVLLMVASPEGKLSLRPEDVGEGDALLLVRPADQPRPKMDAKKATP